MSWIIGEYIRQLPYIKEGADIDSDVYNNAIMIEKTISDLVEKNIITQRESDVIWAVSAGYSYSEIARMLSMHRLTISQIFKDVTDRVSFILGGELTDSAFLERLGTIEPISEKEMEKLFRSGLARINRNE
jgi:hypothetical protein